MLAVVRAILSKHGHVSCTQEYVCLTQNMTVNDKWNFVSIQIVNVMTRYVQLRLTPRHNLPCERRRLKKVCKRKKQLYIVK